MRGRAGMAKKKGGGAAGLNPVPPGDELILLFLPRVRREKLKPCQDGEKKRGPPQV